MNKLEKLRHILETQTFYDFYTGPMESAITGEFERDTPEWVANEKKVEDYLKNMLAKLEG